MRYLGYEPIDAHISFWAWLHYSWNFVGVSRIAKHYHHVRLIGVRWFGHTWEKEVEIPHGELRF